MRDQSAMAQLASLIGDPARGRMLEALMSGLALTATELALAAEVGTSTASSHLAKLTRARVVTNERRGRHKYFRLADTEIAELLESLVSVADRRPTLRRVGPADPALRDARICYDHLAGARGVWLLERLRERRVLHGWDAVELSPDGAGLLARFGINVDALARGRRPLCRTCLDWSERRHHLAGALGAAILERILSLRWARRVDGGRALIFSAQGERNLRRWLSP